MMINSSPKKKPPVFRRAIFSRKRRHSPLDLHLAEARGERDPCSLPKGWRDVTKEIIDSAYTDGVEQPLLV